MDTLSLLVRNNPDSYLIIGIGFRWQNRLFGRERYDILEAILIISGFLLKFDADLLKL